MKLAKNAFNYVMCFVVLLLTVLGFSICAAAEEDSISTSVQEVSAGDINGDGNVNNRDIAYLIQYINGWEVEVVEITLDTNGDGKVNNKDYIVLVRYINGWDVTLFGGTPKCEHVEIIDPAVLPTCTETGLTEGKHCSSCGKVIVKQEVLSVRHTYGDNLYMPCTICGEIKYIEQYFALTELADGTYSIKAKDAGNMPAEVVIPPTYKGKTITTIEEWAFSNRAAADDYPGHVYETPDILSVTIPNTVTTIGMAAFDACTNLTSVVLPDSVTMIDIGVFQCCRNLKSITIPASVTSIMHIAFNACDSLTDVYYGGSREQWKEISIGAWNDPLLSTYKHYGDTPDEYFEFTLMDDDTYSIKAKDVNDLPEDVIIPSIYNEKAVTRIDDFAFYYCSNLKRITLPKGITKIGRNAFSNCANLADINLPDGLEYIDYRAFYGCSSLGSIFLPNTVSNLEQQAFSNCINLTNITIPQNITSISSGVFSYCDNLVNVVISDSVTSIGNSAFNNCTNLTDVYFKGTEQQWQNMNIEAGNDMLIDAVLHYKEIIAPTSDEHFVFTLLEDGTYSIRVKEEYQYNMPTTVVIPSTYNGIAVTAIDEWGFCPSRGQEGANFTNIIIPNSIKTIGMAAFAYCHNLTTATIPEGITFINIGTFQDCTSLKEVYIPQSVIAIYDTAFVGSINVTDVFYGGTELRWQDVAIGEWNDPFVNDSANIYCNSLIVH